MFDAKTKKHKVSKRTKKSWRKYIDFKDVDAFLENSRLEERLGIPFSKRTDTQLFIIDKTDVTGNVISKCAARLALKSKEPRCFASLKPHTHVPDPISKRNLVRTKEEHTNSMLCQPKVERKIMCILKLKEKEALKNRMLTKAVSANHPKKGENKDDIWNGTNVLLPETVTEWMSSDSIRHTISHLGMKKRKVPSLLRKKSSVLPAVEMPHPGTSYNPSYDDHQKLLHEVAQKELELMKQEEHLDRVTTQMFKKISLNKRDEYMMKEMSEGLPKNQTSNFKSIEEDHDKGDLSIVIKNDKSVKNTKKTLVQRRKQREQKQAANKRALSKLEKKKVSDIYKLKILQKQIDAKEKKQELLRQKRMKKHERKLFMPKNLSKTKFEPIDLDFQLAEELTGNLRNCKPSKNLLKERYKSLQQRNIVAPTVIKLKRDKAKMKQFVKPDHKINLDDIKGTTILQ
ncbi:ribosome biogenesis protein NOP53 [Temnothorax curvispinosus]|uniref:Ribosome biogenesis protein NOP53 n=1 Tax=Temnothorax curvispinosus TaxID=300111 RepID=A0A6J1QWS6_9HYME|nr:ribosome biogenesis protein NOP53 [Temnothorax curvispinosus]XP_024885101.1 ribosome biogenesis protein NOP53 [Temnothorax curvispinosus]XP_024885102.1 ribosome biogenesis protein NOP53 [Temnothorax curvispinosus]